MSELLLLLLLHIKICNFLFKKLEAEQKNKDNKANYIFDPFKESDNFMKRIFSHAIICGLGLSLMVSHAGDVKAESDIFGGIYDFDSAEGKSSYGTVFNQNLYKGYYELSLELRGITNSIDTELFNHKALLASKGSPVDPDQVMDRELYPEEKTVFQDALFRLYDAYAKGGKEFAPALSATAQVSFDCWIEATEDGATIYATECRDRFEKALTNIERVANKDIVAITVSPPLRAIEVPVEPVVAVVEPVPVPEIIEPVVDEIPQEVLDQYITIPFEFDKTKFASGGEESLKKALDALNAYERLNVELIAHADRAGPAAYNKKLSQRRADAVLARLIKEGIGESRIKLVEAVGEEKSLFPTKDGVPSQENRVVELDLVKAE